MIFITRVVYTNPLHTTNLFFSFFAAHVLLVWFIQQQTVVLLSILQNQGIQIQKETDALGAIYTSGATTCTYTYEIFKEKKMMRSYVAISSSKTCSFMFFQVLDPKSHGVCKLSQYQASHEGRRVHRITQNHAVLSRRCLAHHCEPLQDQADVWDEQRVKICWAILAWKNCKHSEEKNKAT